MENPDADIATGTAAVQEAEINRRRTLDGQLMDIVAELSQAQEQLAQTNPQLEVSRYAADQDVLRATVDGRVAGVAQTGPGAARPASLLRWLTECGSLSRC